MPESDAPRTLRALLVGIDEYRSPVPGLRGCVNDIRRVSAWLEKRAIAAGDRFDPLLLENERATRQAVIDGFRQHLGAASERDTVVFYYSGHGSQEPARPEQLAVEPDGRNETLVLVDSRHGDVYDLADKELAVLVGEVAAVAGHVLVVLDCCHSGSGVRSADQRADVRVRQVSGLESPRPREAYLTGARAVGGVDTDRLTPSGGRYVLLAACRSDQEAKEMRVDGAARGVFSVALERALSGIGGAPTYADVERWVAAAARNLAVDQAPVLEAPTAADAGLRFLGGVAAPSGPVRTAAFVRVRGWCLDAGRLHGVAPVVAGDPTELSLYRLGAPGPVLTTATVTEVRATTSDLAVADPGALDREAAYLAVITRSGTPQATVSVHGTGEQADAVRELVRRSRTLQPAADDRGADLVIECTERELLVQRPTSPRPLAAAVSAGARDAATEAVVTAEHIGWWIDLTQRTNLSTALEPDEVQLAVVDAAGDPVEPVSGAAEVSYTADGGPRIGIRYANHSAVPLHCAVLGLSELYGVQCLTIGGSELLAPGAEAWVLDVNNRPRVQTFVPEGQERTTDVLILLASTEPFDAQAMQQPELSPPTRATRAPGGARGFNRGPAPVPTGSDWTTRTLLVTTVRPGSWTPLPDRADQAVPLTDGVRLAGHPGLDARVRLSSRPSAGRSATVPIGAAALLELPGEPYAFGTTRSVGDELAVLDVDLRSSAAAVTEQRPLLLEVDEPIAPDELVLPYASDGEDLLPLGIGRPGDARLEIRMDRLPELTQARARSLGGSLRIMFHKLVLSRLGVGYDHPLLSLVHYGDGEPSYTHDLDEVRRGVRDAQRVLLLVHGIIGDTRGMAAAVGPAAAAGAAPIQAGYDTVLAMDYENIHTHIRDNADALAERIAAVGLDTGRKIDVVAHSMGGLVSRSWIERRGGAAAVRRLVTCGTPHAGSPWPRVQDLATAGLALGLNQLGGIPGTVLGFLVRGVEHLDNAMDDMQPGSPLLTELAAAAAPDGVRYVTITGDEPFGADGDATRAGRILRKLRLPAAALGLLFGGSPHDLAVSVSSASAVGAGWPTAPTVLDADCNHHTYFAADRARAALRSALTG